MKIIEVKENKKQYLDLLLLADEQEDMSWNLWIPNIYQSTQVLSVTFIISANSHYIFIFLETIRSDSFISTSNLLQY